MDKVRSLLSLAGDLVRSINPSLLDAPPPAIERSGHDVCYLGPNGETSHDTVVYCRDLMEGHRAMVGSWYIHPERHVVECVVVVIISLAMIQIVQPAALSSRRPVPGTKDDGVSSHPPPAFIRMMTSIVYACQLAYKLVGYPGKVLMMGMPCNVMWTMYMAMCFLPLGSHAMHVMYHLAVPYTILAVVAVATPDTSDITMWMEVPFFFFMHYALIAYPAYFLWCGRISASSLLSNFLHWWMLSCAYFGLFYFGIAVPLSLLCGINLNYMLSPPPSPGDFLSGPNFRLVSTLACAMAFLVSQLVFVATAAVMGRWAGGRVVLLSVSKKGV